MYVNSNETPDTVVEDCELALTRLCVGGIFVVGLRGGHEDMQRNILAFFTAHRDALQPISDTVLGESNIVSEIFAKKLL